MPFPKSDFNVAAAKNTLLCVESGRLDMNVRERCEAISRLKDLVDIHAPLSNSSGDQYDAVSSDPLGHACREIVLLCRTLRFSPGWVDHAEKVSWQLGQSLAAENPEASMTRLWSGLDINGRLAVMKHVATQQCVLFSSPGLKFETPAISTARMPENILGGFVFLSNFDRGKNSTFMEFNRDWLEKTTLDKAMIAIWHEQLHSIHFQLGLAIHDESIHASHRFHADAEMMHAKILYAAHGSIRYGEDVYSSDVEENLGFKTQDLFSAHYKGFSGRYLSSVFKTPGSP